MAAMEPPSERSSYYTCPHCGTLTNQTETHLYQSVSGSSRSAQVPSNSITLRHCARCGNGCLWYKQKLLYPLNDTVTALPHPDLPDDIRVDVDEARMIMNFSPRSSAALLRLSLEKLCNYLQAEGKTIDDKIRWLVRERRLDPMVQQTLDVVRVVGNEAVHPGVLDLRDDVEVVSVLFGMMNEIVEELITRPQRILKHYQRLPEDKRKAAEEKDHRNREG